MIESYGQWIAGHSWLGREWVCKDADSKYRVGTSDDDGCNINALVQDADNWTVTTGEACHYGGSNCIVDLQDMPINYCLTKPVPPHCTIRISTTVLGIVVGCNIAKAVCLILTACNTFEPLATVGDAMASFLEVRDGAMEGTGLASLSDAKFIQPWVMIRGNPIAPRYKTKTLRWKDSVSTKRWYSCIALWVSVSHSLSFSDVLIYS